MTTWLSAIFLVVGFIIVSKLVGLIEKCKQVFAISREAATILGDSSMDELEQERAIQQRALHLLRLFCVVTILSALAVLSPLLIVYGASLLGLVSLEQVIELTLSWRFIILISGVSLLYFLFKSIKR